MVDPPKLKLKKAVFGMNIYKIWQTGRTTGVLMFNGQSPDQFERILNELRKIGCIITNKQASNVKVLCSFNKLRSENHGKHKTRNQRRRINKNI